MGQKCENYFSIFKSPSLKINRFSCLILNSAQGSFYPARVSLQLKYKGKLPDLLAYEMRGEIRPSYMKQCRFYLL